MATLSGNSRREAVRSYLERKQAAVSCVLQVPVVPVVGPNPDTIGLRLGPGLPQRLPSLSVSVNVKERVAISASASSRFEATTSEYAYQVLDRDGMELLHYHLHPGGASHVKHPHVHIAPLAPASARFLANKHLPTGAVELEDFVRFLITELGARPLRTDWEEILRA